MVLNSRPGPWLYSMPKAAQAGSIAQAAMTAIREMCIRDRDILHSTGPGRLRTLIIRGRASDVTARLEGLSPIFMEAVPLTLEELFIYELGGEGHEVRDIIL